MLKHNFLIISILFFIACDSDKTTILSGKIVKPTNNKIQLLKDATGYMNRTLRVLEDMGVKIDPLAELEREGKENITQDDIIKKFIEMKKDIVVDAGRGSETTPKGFKRLKAVVGGETGIDIFPKGYDKSQIIRDFDPTDTLHFFGDAMEPTGNDYPLKKVIIDNDLGMCYNVNSWKDTRELLYEKK